MTYALDTNIVIHLIIGSTAVSARFEECLLEGNKIAISPYVDFEVRRGLRYKNATAKERIYERLCSNWEIGEMRRSVWLRAVNIYCDLRRKGFTVGDADILIAAYCIENQYVLVTNNVKDYKDILGLHLVDWVI